MAGKLLDYVLPEHYRDRDKWRSFARWKESCYGRDTPEVRARWAEDDVERDARRAAYRERMAFKQGAPKGRVVRAEVVAWVGTEDAASRPPNGGNDYFRREVFARQTASGSFELLCPACATGRTEVFPTVLFDARGLECNVCGVFLVALER